MRVARETLLWSFPAFAFFGICNFLIDVSNKIDADSWAVVGVLWLSSGILALAPLAYFYPRRGAVFFPEAAVTCGPLSEVLGPNTGAAREVALPPRAGSTASPATSVVVLPQLHQISRAVKLTTVMGGLMVGLSQMLMKASFSMAPALSGPLCAVIGSDPIVVSTFCHFFYHERISLKQAGAILVIVAGIALMALGTTATPSDSGADTHGSTLLAFGMSLCGMVCFAFAVLAIRAGCTGNLSVWSSFLVRMLTMAALGSSACIYSVVTVGFPVSGTWLWVAPVLAGLFQAAGVFCVNQALQHPNTGIANAIFASNSIVVLILNVAVFRLLPGALALFGMAVVVLGVATISLVGSGGEDEGPVPDMGALARCRTSSASSVCMDLAPVTAA